MRFCHSIGAKMIRYEGNCGIKAKTLKLKDFLNGSFAINTCIIYIFTETLFNTMKVCFKQAKIVAS